MKHYLSLAFFGLALLLPITAKAADCGNDPVYNRDWSGKTNIGSRVRSIACMEGSDILTVLPSDTVVHIIAETDGWYKVQAGDKTGWVGARLINVTGQDGSDASAVTAGNSSAPSPTDLIGIDEVNFGRLKAGDAGLRNRLRNMVVLRVHFHGEAYLVNADGTLKLLTADEVKAYKLGQKIEKKSEANEKKAGTGAALKIRKLIGIDEADFAKLEAGDLGLRERLMDQLVLRVHSHGQAYWVNPAGGLKFLGPGEVGYYLTQNLTKDDPIKSESSGDEYKDESDDNYQSVSGSIALEGQLTDPGKVKLTWTTDGLDASKGFKVVISENENPVYPGNSYHYLTDPGTRLDYWSNLTSGKTYHFRVCQYLGGACGIYSNDIAVMVATNGAQAENTMPGTIDLTVVPVAGGKANISWALSDMVSPKGFKVVIDENANPVYPGNDYHYLSDPDIRTDIWTGLNSGSAYHFRVCEYLGGYCGTYSNDVEVIAL